MYADDTTLHCCLEDIEDDNKEFRINLELQHVQDWLKVNRLALNVKKTKYMMFHKQGRKSMFKHGGDNIGEKYTSRLWDVLRGAKCRSFVRGFGGMLPREFFF